MAEKTGKTPPGNYVTSEIELSALDQIRQAEAEITRQVAAAREAAVQSLDTARKKASQISVQAREEGRQEAQKHCQEIIQAAEKEAKQIVNLAQIQVDNRARKSNERIELAVQIIVDLVTGTEKMNETN